MQLKFFPLGWRFWLALGLVPLAWVAAKVPSSAQEMTKMKYPTTKTVEQVDDYHGTKIADPYRWLEDADSPETKAWITAQNEVTDKLLASIPQREQIHRRLTKLWNFPRYSVPFQRLGHYFYSKNDGLQNQAVLYTADSLNGEPRLLLDPNTLSADGTVALSGMALSDDAKRLAYGLAKAGSDWQEWRVRDVATGKDLPDLVEWVKFSNAAWTNDSQGFFYSRFDEPQGENQFTAVNYYQKLYYHKLGDKQSQDTLIYRRDDEKEWGFGGEVTEDGKYLIIDVTKGTDRKNLLFYRDLQTPSAPVVELIKDWHAQYGVVGSDGPVFYVLTDDDAPRYRLVAIDINKPGKENWKTLIPQSEHLLQFASVVGDQFFATYLQDARSVVKRFDLAGQPLGEVALPGIGTAGGFTGRRDDKDTFYSFTGFTTPASIYRFDLASGKSEVFKQPQVDFSPSDFETKQVFYQSKDGTRVPMFITHKKGLVLDGSNPTLLYGYGGFNISLTPSFSVSRMVWMEMGGVYAVPNLRGGGEYGREWHESGMKEHKQNVFDDFITAAEWLIREKYTSPSKLAIAGGSNGGLLVGACMTQRPDLYGAALPAVGVMDMLRFHKYTIGWAWVGEFGSADEAAQFPVLHKYSPLHNLKAGTKYPATLITTADHDDRVVPAHSFKYAAALQAAQGGPAPTLIRIDVSAGHGAGKPTTKMIDEVTDTYSFLIPALGMNVPVEK
jgi:prolyl oligopeptidase